MHLGRFVVEKSFLSVHPHQLRSSGKSPDFPELGIWPGGPTAEPVQLLQAGAEAHHSSRASEPTVDGYPGGPPQELGQEPADTAPGRTA